jgi:hypothetical protein
LAAFNVVRFRVKSGHEEKFVEAHRKAPFLPPGFVRASLIKTGERTYCIIGEWDRMSSLANARPQMIGLLDQFRDTLEDLGGELGVTDPVSGDTVVEMKP